MTTTATPLIYKQRKSFRLEKSGYPQSWYAVALSEELSPGKIQGFELCDGRVILYRDTAGEPHALSRHCKHMGADLSLGDIVGDTVRCPFHHWQYNSDGICTRLATSDKIPPQARLVNFPTAEAWGLIWVFWGLEPLYDLPSFHPSLNMDRMVWKAFEIKLSEPLRVDPWIMGMNAFDYQHLIALHGLGEYDPQYDNINWKPYTIEKQRGAGLIYHGFGASAAHGEARRHLGIAWDTAYLSGTAPLGSAGRRSFMVEAASIGDGSPGDRAKAEQLLNYMCDHHTRVINQDVAVLNSLDPEEPGLFVKADAAITRYLQWAKAYPTTTIVELMETAEAAGLSGGSSAVRLQPNWAHSPATEVVR